MEKQLVIALLVALVSVSFTFFLNQVFNNKKSEVYYTKFASAKQFIGYILEHRYTKKFYKGLVRAQVWCLYLEGFCCLLLLWLKNSGSFETNFTKSIMLICTVLFLSGILKYCMYKVFGLIKYNKDFNINMLFG